MDQIAQATKFKNDIAQLNLKKKNPWQAPPITHYETVFNRKEKKNEDVKPMRLRVNFKTSEALKKSGASYLKLSFPVNERLQFKTHFQLDKDGVIEWIIDEKSALKLIDRKDLFVSLKKKGFFFSRETLEKKSFKLTGLGQKCDFEKDVKLKNCDFVLSFHMHEPIRQKEWEEIPVKKLVLDSFPEPLKGYQQPTQ